jgi:hypothetical protein
LTDTTTVAVTPRVQIDLTLPWEEGGTAVTRLLDDEVAGKAVLTL